MGNPEKGREDEEKLDEKNNINNMTKYIHNMTR